jgi:hypothetical protein
MSKSIETDRRSGIRLRPEKIEAVIINSVFEVVLGTLICTGVVRFFTALFSTFPESLTRLALVPYASATLIFCIAGLRIPNGRYFMLISVLPASLMNRKPTSLQGRVNVDSCWSGLFSLQREIETERRKMNSVVITSQTVGTP